MAQLTLVFSVLLVALGLGGFVETGGADTAELIPVWIGLLLCLSSLLAIRSNEGRRKLFLHINATIGIVSFLGGAIEAVLGCMRAASAGLAPDRIALASQLALAGLMLIYVILCLWPLVAVRRTGKDRDFPSRR